MKPIEFIPRLHQMKEFIEACEMESASERRHLFMSLFNLTDEDVNYLIFHGMIPLDSPSMCSVLH